jgi:16S rRNA (uracil1498-N3)-methyltransferase
VAQRGAQSNRCEGRLPRPGPTIAARIGAGRRGRESVRLRAMEDRGRDLGRFVLADADEPRLTDEDSRHLARVLRAAPGDRLAGIDGAGARLPLVVRSVGRRELELEPAGPLVRTPPPGAAGSPLPAIEVACAPPRPSRIEPMLDRLTQLGAARIRLLSCRRTGPEDRRPRSGRLGRVLLESAKQSRQDWIPELTGPAEPACGPGATLLCDPLGAHPLLACLAELGTALASRSEWSGGPRPDPVLTLLVGPEGGFDPQERDELVAGGAIPVRLGPGVLRIETAAESALAAALLQADAQLG